MFSIIRNYYHYFRKPHTVTVDNTNLEKDYLKLTKNIENPNLDMSQIRQKTQDALTRYPYYRSLLSYMSGNCILNSKLSKNKPITEQEKTMLENINTLIENVEPLDYPVLLFHGFEKLTEYNEQKLDVGNVLRLRGFLSKSVSFEVSLRFATNYKNPYDIHILAVDYPVGSRHLNLDIRHPDNEEYEYLTHSNEELRIKHIFRSFSWRFLIPTMTTIYFCVPVQK